MLKQRTNISDLPCMKPISSFFFIGLLSASINSLSFSKQIIRTKTCDLYDYQFSFKLIMTIVFRTNSFHKMLKCAIHHSCQILLWIKVILRRNNVLINNEKTWLPSIHFGRPFKKLFYYYLYNCMLNFKISILLT